jgi:hypothetical protein
LSCILTNDIVVNPTVGKSSGKIPLGGVLVGLGTDRRKVEKNPPAKIPRGEVLVGLDGTDGRSLNLPWDVWEVPALFDW